AQQLQRQGPGAFAGRRPTGPNMNQLRAEFLVQEGALGLLVPSTRDGGTLRAANTASRAADAPKAVPTVLVAAEHYGRLSRLLDSNIPVTIEIDRSEERRVG